MLVLANVCCDIPPQFESLLLSSNVGHAQLPMKRMCQIHLLTAMVRKNIMEMKTIVQQVYT